MALGLTTTAFGTLLPILRDNDMLGGRFGRFVLPAGAVGEFLPIVGHRGVPERQRSVPRPAPRWWRCSSSRSASPTSRASRTPSGSPRITHAGEDATSQITLRLTVVLLFALLTVASRFGLDVVLGAFLAGVVLRRWAPGDTTVAGEQARRRRLRLLHPGLLRRLGHEPGLDSIAEAPLRLLVFFVLLLVVRGLPALLLYRHDLSRSERMQMAFLTATALPLLVALSEIGLSNGHMLPENAAALVGAGVLSVVVFPGAAVALNHRAGRRPATTTPSRSGRGPSEAIPPDPSPSARYR